MLTMVNNFMIQREHLNMCARHKHAYARLRPIGPMQRYAFSPNILTGLARSLAIQVMGPTLE